MKSSDEQLKNQLTIEMIKVLVAVAAVGATIVAAFIGRFPPFNPKETPTPVVITATSLQTANVFTSTPWPVNTKVSGITSEQTKPPIQENKNQPAIEEIPVFILREYTGAQKTVSYERNLNEDEVIVGSGWGFEKTTGGCVAFIVMGSGQFHFTVIDGVYELYSHVKTENAANQLMNRQIEILKGYGCSDQNTKIDRMP